MKPWDVKGSAAERLPFIVHHLDANLDKLDPMMRYKTFPLLAEAILKAVFNPEMSMKDFMNYTYLLRRKYNFYQYETVLDKVFLRALMSAEKDMYFTKKL